MLMERKLVSVPRIGHDRLRVRASAGKGSFRREERLQSLLEQAQAQVAALKTQREAPAGTERNARQAARRGNGPGSGEQVRNALAALEEVKKVKARAKEQSAG